jgi:hypothetical protein
MSDFGDETEISCSKALYANGTVLAQHQSVSANPLLPLRFTAGAPAFFILSQSGVGPIAKGYRRTAQAFLIERLT